MNFELKNFMHSIAVTNENKTGNVYVLGHYLLDVKKKTFYAKQHAV